MKNWIVALFCIGLSFDTFAKSSIAPTGNLPLKADTLTFSYEPFENGTILTCTHSLEDANAQDWNVTCKNAAGNTEKSYRVHLWVTSYERTSVPKLSYELLYWVTDKKSGESAGSTTWLHLKDASSLYGLDVRQSVDADTAGLYLKIDLSK